MGLAMKISIMIDMIDSFLHEHVTHLINKIKLRGHIVDFITNTKSIPKGDVLFLLGCSTILTSKELSLNKHNLVVHPSKLPKGRGSAALVWKILEGVNVIYLTLFEANEKIDKGDIYFQEKIEFEGHELSDEIRSRQAEKIKELVLKFLDQYSELKPKKQEGKCSYYPKRTPKDSELDIDKTIREQFNLLRVSDNERYPAYFNYNGHKYFLKIYKDK